MNDRFSRRAFNSLLFSVGAAHVMTPALHGEVTWSQSMPTNTFLHPGMLHNRADLERMRDGVRDRTQPILAGFEALRTHPLSQLTYTSSGASVEMGRNPTVHSPEFDRDSNAAYQCALMSCITGDLAYAKVAIIIMNAWSATLKKISGADAVLCAGLGPFKMLNAAELLRHTDSGWAKEDAEQFGAMMREAVLPVIANFAPFANGNWDTAALKMMMAIAIYDDDRPLFEKALLYYRFGCGDGQLAHYIYANGECQESGRDQQHTQLGIAHMGDCCEMAWHQGLDLYGTLDNRLLLGFEYTARYCLGEDIAFEPDIDQTGKYRHEVISPRSNLRPVFEQIYNHYAHRRGIPAPWTQHAAEKIRPEGPGPGADQTGFGTLLYTRNTGPDTSDGASVAVASGLHAVAINGVVKLDFVPVAGAMHYTVSRAEGASTAYTTIAQNIVGSVYRDRTTKPSHLYSYQVRATGSRRSSLPAHQMAGLPSGWKQQNVGLSPLNGTASFDGETYRLQAGGAPPTGPGNSAFFVHHSIPSNGTFIARVVPLIASQSLELGIGVLSDENVAGIEAMLMLSPRGQAERPAWSTALLRRGQAGAPLQTVDSHPLSAPAITYGRLVAPLWLRLQRTGSMLATAYSSDGVTWSEFTSTNLPEGGLRVGLFVNSGLEKVTTEACFDKVTLTA